MKECPVNALLTVRLPDIVSGHGEIDEQAASMFISPKSGESLGNTHK